MPTTKELAGKVLTGDMSQTSQTGQRFAGVTSVPARLLASILRPSKWRKQEMTIKKTISEFGQVVTTSSKPKRYRSRMLEIRNKDGEFIAMITQSYTGSVTLVSGEGFELKESK
tara:strand:+ start:102 stop:443 length:342 start_codon:yes stop_codon:yes gene_type:complete